MSLVSDILALFTPPFPTTRSAAATAWANALQPHLAGFSKRTVLTGSGTFTPTVPGNPVRFYGEGGGGGGGGVPFAGASSIAVGSGGDAGCPADIFISSAAASYDYVVGAGGVGAANAPGGDGGDTTVNIHGGANVLTAKGGKGGQVMTAGSSISVALPVNNNTGSVGDLVGVGALGGSGWRFSSAAAVSGEGGHSRLGQGGLPVDANSDGNPGVGKSSGGSGGCSSNGGGAGGGQKGGDGALAWLCAEEFF